MTQVIPLNQAEVTDEDVRCVAEALRTGVLTLGTFLAEFEQLVAERTRRTHAVGVGSGAAAIEIALHALGIGPGD